MALCVQESCTPQAPRWRAAAALSQHDDVPSPDGNALLCLWRALVRLQMLAGLAAGCGASTDCVWQLRCGIITSGGREIRTGATGYLVQRSRQAQPPCRPGPTSCRLPAAAGDIAALLEAAGPHQPSGHHGAVKGDASSPLLRPIQQQPVELTEEGFVPSTASLAHVPPHLAPLLDAAVAACQQALGADSLVGVYLRGSMVQGCFLPGASDADFVAIYLPAQQQEHVAGSASTNNHDSIGGSSSMGGVLAALRRAAESLRRQFPECTKVELKAVALPRGSPLGTLWLRQQRQNNHQRPGSGDSLGGGELCCYGKQSTMSSIPPSALFGQETLAFLLKTQAVCLHGWDLPTRLPDVAALPPLQLLPSLPADVAGALRHAGMLTQHAADTAEGPSANMAAVAPTQAGIEMDSSSSSSTSDAATASRAVRWALKRCIRAAFELYLCCSSGGSGGSATVTSSSGSATVTSSSSSGSGSVPGSASGTDSSVLGSGSGTDSSLRKVFSRDLYWCVHYASQQHPELAELLKDALALYLELGSHSQLSSPSADTIPGGPSTIQTDIAAATAAAPATAVGQRSSGQESQLLIQRGARLAVQLAAELDAFFLDAMLAEHPGWLTYHTGGSNELSLSQDPQHTFAPAAAPAAASRRQGRQAAAKAAATSPSVPQTGSTRPSSSKRSGGGSGWWQRLKVALWAAAAGDRMEEDLVGGPPPPVLAAPVAGSVLTLDWRQPEARRQAAAIIAAAAFPELQLQEEGWCLDSISSTTGSSRIERDPLAVHHRTVPQPVLLKGAAAHWPALQRWSLSHLAAAGLQGKARVAPSLQFPFTEPRLAALLAARTGAAALPSCLASMAAAEFAARLQRSNPCRLPPLVYGGEGPPAAADAGSFGTGWPFPSWTLPDLLGAAAGPEAAGRRQQQQHSPSEFCYFQAELPPQLLADADLSSPPFVLPEDLLEALYLADSSGGSGSRAASSPSGGSGSRATAGRRLRQAQAARVWVGPQGAVSPTHYDLSHSFLAQVKGRKRMLFWSPDQLPLLSFHPDTHLLRRRSRVNMHAPPRQQPGGRAFPLMARAAASEALLEPGDVIFFPSRWAHYTEGLDFNMSVTCRFRADL